MQEVLKLYSKELPAMNYAANTGKESMFLERCISNGYGAFHFLFLDLILTVANLAIFHPLFTLEFQILHFVLK